MNYWVFNEEQLQRAMAAAADHPDLNEVDVISVKAFLFSTVCRELKMLRGSTDVGKTDD